MEKKIDLLPFFTNFKNLFFLFVAPPGWGKTTMILDLYKSYEGKVIFVSPLRALGEEFFKRASAMDNVYEGKSNESVNIFLKKKKALLVLTAEKLNEEVIEIESKKDTIFIFDEFHLFYYWGESFRPLLKERMMKVVNEGGNLLALTATMSDKLMKKTKNEFLENVDEFYFLNIGNQRLINFPVSIRNYNFISEKVFNRSFIRSVQSSCSSGVVLLFVKYRAEVENWVSFLNRIKVNSLGCVGGEVGEFILNLEKSKNLKCIVSTTSLSHGVNLPAISKVYISYPVNNKDFWIQMVGRGGRDGSDFELHHREKIKWNIKKLLWNSYQIMILLWQDFSYQISRGRV